MAGIGYQGLRKPALLLVALLVTACGNAGSSGRSQQPGTSTAPSSVHLQGANPLAESNQQVGVPMDEWAAMLKERSGGRLSADIVHGGSLLTVPDAPDGIASGIADFAYFHPGQLGGRFPVDGPIVGATAISESQTPDLAGQILIQMALYDEFPAYRDTYERQGLKLLFPTAGAPHIIICTDPIHSLGDLKGKKIRGTGEIVALLSKGLGGEPITIQGSDLYGAMSTGLADCAWSTPDFFLEQKFYEVAPNVVVTGPQKSFPQVFFPVVAMNLDVYNSLPDDLKKIIDDSSKDVAVKAAQRQEQVYEDALQGFLDAGHGDVYHLSDSDVATWRSNTPDILGTIAQQLDNGGYPGTKLIAKYRELAAAYIAKTWP